MGGQEVEFVEVEFDENVDLPLHLGPRVRLVGPHLVAYLEPCGYGRRTKTEEPM
jgi:hypothetical protein